MQLNGSLFFTADPEFYTGRVARRLKHSDRLLDNVSGLLNSMLTELPSGFTTPNWIRADTPYVG